MNQTVPSLAFKFHGKTGEYFRIWIVNIMLSIITLGIYSAWAKVRNKRYFYSNTELDGSSFEYLANPVAILKGRMIAVGVFAIYTVIVAFVPLTEPVFLIAFIGILPWLIVRALTFNARNSAFRNVRFDFSASYGQAAMVYIVFPLLIMVTFGLAYPYFAYRHRDFIVSNSNFGTTGFDFDASAKQFYAIYIKVFIALLLTGILVAVGLPALLSTAQAAAGGIPAEQLPPPAPEMLLIALVPMMVILPFYMLVGIYIQTATTNLVFNSASAQQHRFISTLKVGRMFWIYFSNLLAILASLGLLIPWAKIRLAHYRFDNLELEAVDGLGTFIASEQERVKATGEELAEVFDIDLGL